METKWYYIPVGLVVALALIFFIAFMLNQPQVSEQENANYVNVNGDEYLDLDYISEEEVGLGDTSIESDLDFIMPTKIEDCLEENEYDRDYCYSLYSYLNKDESACGGIVSTGIQSDCYASVAQQKQDPKICESVSIGKSDCYVTVAIDTNNAALCEYGDLEKESCYKAAASGKFSDCIEGYDKRFCNDAVVARDASLCENIPDLRGSCYLDVGINTNTPSLCNKATARDHCFFTIATTVNNPAICENLTETRDNCVAWVAFNTMNKDLCYQAGAEAQSCIEDIELS